MIKSMTGFASVSVEAPVATVAVTIRTVNHRHLDVQVRLPSALAERETAVRSLVQRHAARGRVEVSITLLRRQPDPVSVTLNQSLVESIAAAFDGVRARGLVDGPLSPADVLRMPQALTIVDAPPDPAAQDALTRSVMAALEDALQAVDAMRMTEGAHLRDDLECRLTEFGRLVDALEGAAAAGAIGLHDRLVVRVTELTRDLPVDPSSVAQEIVKLVSRSDVSEEIVRLRGHLAHWAALVDDPEPCGRKLDFLLQEMNREVNTLAAKAEGARVSVLAVDAKAELEKLREQVQNVE